MPKRDRAQYMREYRARKRQSAGAGLDAPVAPSRAPESESEAAPGPEAEPAASPEAGASPAVPEIPERYAETLRFLAGPSMRAAVPNEFAVICALATLAKDCGYTLEPPPGLTPLEAP